jgi:hypothetical protein
MKDYIVEFKPSPELDWIRTEKLDLNEAMFLEEKFHFAFWIARIIKAETTETHIL